jgi:hypothetical protein
MLTGCQVGAQHAAPLQEPADALWRIPIDLAAGLGLRFPPNVTAPPLFGHKEGGKEWTQSAVGLHGIHSSQTQK